MKEKGPWFVGAMHDALFIIDQKPRHAPVDYLTAGPKDLNVIAKIEPTGDIGEHLDNANLMAAAPQLLEALKGFYEADLPIQCTSPECMRCKIREKARLAIKKAGG